MKASLAAQRPQLFDNTFMGAIDGRHFVMILFVRAIDGLSVIDGHSTSENRSSQQWKRLPTIATHVQITSQPVKIFLAHTRSLTHTLSLTHTHPLPLFLSPPLSLSLFLSLYLSRLSLLNQDSRNGGVLRSVKTAPRPSQSAPRGVSPNPSTLNSEP
jgi:hypothetical protein